MGMLFLFLSSAILIGLVDTLMMTWGGPVGLRTAVLRGLKHASMTVAIWGTLGRSFAAFAAVNRGFRMVS